MVSKPSITNLPKWAENDVLDSVSGQNNVIEPPEEKMLSGWDRLEFPPRNWFNWLGRYTYRWLNWLNQQEAQAIVTDGNGLLLFPVDDALITLNAVDKSTSGPPNILVATGYKGAGVAPDFDEVYSTGGTLSLGVGTIPGDQPITGGTAGNIIVWGQSKIIA